MVVKSKLVSEHLGDLGCIFDVLRKHRLRLNASKCSFGVGSGKFLGYIITHWGIKVEPNQIRAIQNLRPPRNPKEIQRLAGMIAALNPFISRSTNRCRPFYLLINKWKGFEWSEECAMAFHQLKEYLARPPIMSNPGADKVLYTYIAVAHHAVSLVLIRDDSGVQKLVYYVSKSLHEAEVKYLPLEKSILAMVHATRKLPHYFQAHTVVVLTQLPLKFVLRAADYTGRIAKWNTILGAFDVKYMPRTAIKGQVLADLTAEFAEPTIEVGAEGRIFDEKPVGTVSVPRSPCWKVYVDGTTNQRGLGVGLVLVSPEDHVIEKSLRLGFSTTNNEAEYEALLQGIVTVQKIEGKSVEIFSDSKQVVGQVKGEMEAKDSRMQEYLSQVKRLQPEFSPFSLPHIPRSRNSHADSLATLATSSAASLPQIILVEHLERASEVARGAIPIHRVGMGPSWMDPIMRFLKDDVLPEEKSEAEKIRRSASRFWMSEDHKLHRCSYSRPYLLCVHPEAAELLLEELHEGICGSHTRGRSLSYRAVTQGYWWPGMQKEALAMSKSVTNAKGPFPKAPGNKRYLLVATDYFTKWVETEPLASIKDMDAKKFLWRNIVTYSTPAYSQGNGHAEAVNKVIVNGLKKRLVDAKGRWVEELSHVLWTYRTTPSWSTRETPFAMTYGAEAMIPLETNFPTQRTSSFTPNSNDKLLGRSLDLVDERRERVMVQLACYQQKLKQRYDVNVKLRPLALGDLVLRKVVRAAKNPSWGKLGPNWEGPYWITSIAGIGAYYLEDLDEKPLPFRWPF
nr:uncharacterized protein LOC111998898 [Quercus suber]